MTSRHADSIRGPLAAIVSDPTFSNGHTTLARSLANFMMVRNQAHARDQSLTQHTPTELTFAQFRMAFMLSTATDGTMSMSELARESCLSIPTTSQMVEQLIRTGIATKARDDHDQRVMRIGLTATGIDVVEARTRRIRARWRQAMDGIDDSELESAARVFDRIATLFDPASR